jgi:hypothetical protein
MSIPAAMRLAAQRIEYQKQMECWKYDIRLWAKERLGIHLYSKQVEIAEAIIREKKVAVKSCHGSGKSYFASLLVAWWVETRYGSESVVVSTAPTGEQVSKILWRYIRQHHSKHSLVGRTTLDNEWKSTTGEELAWGRKPADTNLSGFQGIHSSGGVLAVLDEACGLAESIWTGVEAITTGPLDTILAIGNPDDPATEFGRIFREDDPSWHKITISAFDTPAFTGEWVPPQMLNGLISKPWVEDKKVSWGVDSARYQSKVLGEFPSQGINTLFDQITLAKGIETEITPHQDEKPRLGVDVARFGDDYTTVYSYHSGQLRLVDKWSKKDTVETSIRVNSIARRLGVSEIRIDAVGVGAGVYDQLEHLKWDDPATGRMNYRVVGMIGNAQSPDLHKWVNARAWWYDTFREKMSRRTIDIEFEDKHLKEELEGIQYKFGKSFGAIQIESKDDMKARGVKSPDFADAAMYAVADLPVDPEDPMSGIKPGDEINVGMEDLLFEHEMSISPY